MQTIPFSRVFVLAGLFFGGIACQSGQTPVSPVTNAALTQPQPTAATPAAPNFRLTQVVADGDCGGLGPGYQTTRFTYANATDRNPATMVQLFASGGVELVYTYTYDAQGRVSKVATREPVPNNDGTVGSVTSYTFTPSTIEQTFARFLPNGQLQQVPRAQEGDARYIYRTNADGLVTEWEMQNIVRFGSLTTERFVYTYDNGNVVKSAYINAAGVVEMTITYDYDDKINPYFKLNWLYTLSPELYSSRNNVVGARVNNGPTFKTDYTYNNQGLPLTRKDVTKGGNVTFTYQTY